MKPVAAEAALVDLSDEGEHFSTNERSPRLRHPRTPVEEASDLVDRSTRTLAG
jgi:hypothetical protein